MHTRAHHVLVHLLADHLCVLGNLLVAPPDVGGELHLLFVLFFPDNNNTSATTPRMTVLTHGSTNNDRPATTMTAAAIVREVVLGERAHGSSC